MTKKDLSADEKVEMIASFIGDNFLKLAKALRELQDEKPDIFLKVADLVGVSRRKAYALARISRQFDDLGVAEERLYFIGWTKLQIIGRYLTDMVVQWEQVVRSTIRIWNTLATRSVDLGLNDALTPPAIKRAPYWIAIEDMPGGLQADIMAFLQHLEEPALFANEARQVLKSATVAQYRSNIIMLISALVAVGTPIDSLASLGCAVTPANVEKALIFLHDRFNKRVTSGMCTMAIRARIVAHWCNLSAPAMNGLDDLIERLKAWQPCKRGMTAKNRALLDRLDDQRFRDLIYLLTRRLMERAGRANRPRSAVSLARTAVAIEILLTCSIRRENLVDLELGRNIRKLGQESNAQWIIEFEGEDVKNDEPLRFILPRESADLLEEYLRHWRPLLCGGSTSWLFPIENGAPLTDRSMASDIKRKAQRELGVPITPHQFRHISTELYLRENPDKLSIASRHLGHRDENTTRIYYARSKQREASRLYQERLGLERSKAMLRIKRKRRARSAPVELAEGDML